MFRLCTRRGGSTRLSHEVSGRGLPLSSCLADILVCELLTENTSSDHTSLKLIMAIRYSPQSSLEDLGEEVAKTFNDQAVRSADPSQTRILVVEDNEVNRILVLLQLESLGYTSEGVAGGQQALEILERRQFELILMDCQMPELDGYETTRRLRNLEAPNQHTPIIALTAHAMKGDRARCLSAGMDDYISKPYTQEVLAVAVNHWLE